MNRIRRAYENRFRQLLVELRVRRVEPGVRWQFERAHGLSKSSGVSLNHALVRVEGRLATQVRRFTATLGGIVESVPQRFWCDAGLGGLTRWLRAAGYEATWQPDIDDAVLLREAARAGDAVITTDSLLLERRVVRDRLIPTLWVPPSLTMHEQLAVVLRHWQLPLRSPRCMQCGGQLRRVDKEAVRERIPPKTWRWLDEYFVCARCDQLFWYGTHWQRIAKELDSTGGRPPLPREGPGT